MIFYLEDFEPVFSEDLINFSEFTKTNPVAARVFDADGEFVLVEAADVLPNWVSPKTAERKVWIYDGKVIVLDEKTSADLITVCFAEYSFVEEEF